MKKPRTLLQLQEGLDAELSWRRLEIDALRKMCRSTDGVVRRSLIRAAVPILYAHWEGFVKESACLYIRYLNGLGLSFSDMKKCFRGIYALEYVQTLSNVKKRFFVASDALEQLYAIDTQKFRANLDQRISNVGNLDYEIFEQIMLFLGIETSRYVARKQFIDETLLLARNKIAHGEFLALAEDGLEDMIEQLMNLLRWVKTDIENSVSLGGYLVAKKMSQ